VTSDLRGCPSPQSSALLQQQLQREGGSGYLRCQVCRTGAIRTGVTLRLAVAARDSKLPQHKQVRAAAGDTATGGSHRSAGRHTLSLEHITGTPPPLVRKRNLSQRT
jgi:hypothetical protein